eukprot:gnl/TRDRNA2_/TRDRNA2_59104_c1_seq1.p1 gnl/TRDRNA2_/TRDRNA2_59104_c1~~gnl/TRDRNA2_/TRDRNA2_59104_c1_seq1.p1  ORF type:complete len:289 (+),score=23.02 gnl/TRDRNA2_/TRDRNA2_59104_c1_seq1:90-869(+)
MADNDAASDAGSVRTAGVLEKSVSMISDRGMQTPNPSKERGTVVHGAAAGSLHEELLPVPSRAESESGTSVRTASFATGTNVPRLVHTNDFAGSCAVHQASAQPTIGAAIPLRPAGQAEGATSATQRFQHSSLQSSIGAAIPLRTATEAENVMRSQLPMQPAIYQSQLPVSSALLPSALVPNMPPAGMGVSMLPQHLSSIGSDLTGPPRWGGDSPPNPAVKPAAEGPIVQPNPSTSSDGRAKALSCFPKAGFPKAGPCA